MKKKIVLLCCTLISSLGLFSCEDQLLMKIKDPQGHSSTAGSQKSNAIDKHGIINKNADLTQLGDGFAFTEGPAVDKHGNVFFTDQPNNRIIKWAANSGALTTFLDNSGRSNGMYFDQAGNLITCADMHGEIWSIDKDGNHTVLVDNYNGKLLNGPNDLWINPLTGGIYVTDPLYIRSGYWDLDDPRRNGSQQGGGYVYYLSPDRSTFTRVAGEDFDQNDPDFDKRIIPNGVVGSPDGKKLYVGHIWPEKTYVYDINADGTLSNKKEFADMRTDGMTIDQVGNVYLTNEKGVVVFDKDGAEIANIPTGEGWTANVVFGGQNRKTLFVTALGRVYGIKMNVKGVVK